jgi:hypothetical protein
VGLPEIKQGGRKKFPTIFLLPKQFSNPISNLQNKIKLFQVPTFNLRSTLIIEKKHLAKTSFANPHHNYSDDFSAQEFIKFHPTLSKFFFRHD